MIFSDVGVVNYPTSIRNNHLKFLQHNIYYRKHIFDIMLHTCKLIITKYTKFDIYVESMQKDRLAERIYSPQSILFAEHLNFYQNHSAFFKSIVNLISFIPNFFQFHSVHRQNGYPLQNQGHDFQKKYPSMEFCRVVLFMGSLQITSESVTFD